MARRTLQSMTDEELAAERKSLANVAGKWASRRYSRILDEQMRREGEEPHTEESFRKWCDDLIASHNERQAEKSA